MFLPTSNPFLGGGFIFLKCSAPTIGNAPIWLSFFLNWVVQPSPMVFSKSRILHMLLGQSQRIWEVWSVAKRSLIPWAFQIPSMSLGAIFVHFHVGNFQPKSSEFHPVELTSRKSPKRRGKFDSEIPVLKGSHDLLGGGFKYFLIFTLTWGDDPIWLIFFRWVETAT